MRALCLLVVATIGGWTGQHGGVPAPSGAAASRVVVVIDTDAAAADPPSAARWRDALLQALDAGPAVAYLELTADRLTPVAASEVEPFRRTVFTVTPPLYSGLSVSFPEAVEVLRGNEAVRDDLIAQRCPAAAEGCGGRLLAAAKAEVLRTETVSARKLQRLAAASADWRGAHVVLVTAGWPTRDEGRVGLARAVRDLRARGVRLVVVRLPPPSPYRGLVRDASESLAAHLPAAFVSVTDEADVERAAALLGADLALPLASVAASAPEGLAPVPAVSGDGVIAVPPPPSGTAEGQTPTSPNREVRPSPGAGLDGTLQKAVAYVGRFERTFTEVVWHERYEQEARVWRQFGSSGARTLPVAARRTLESELFFAWLPQDATWITVRDVIALDGRPRPAGDRRLPGLSARGSVSLPELRELARENGRFNVGTIVRTFNEPTLALLFLDDRYRSQVTFSRQGTRQVDGRQRVSYAFVERGHPTMIQNAQHDVPARGSFEIDAASGEVWSTTVEIGERDARLTGRMAVDYQPHVAFDVLVPREMRERYVAHLEEEVTATAVYSDFRRFQTKGRLISAPSR